MVETCTTKMEMTTKDPSKHSTEKAKVSQSSRTPINNKNYFLLCCPRPLTDLLAKFQLGKEIKVHGFQAVLLFPLPSLFYSNVSV
jgi:hypothetical protein